MARHVENLQSALPPALRLGEVHIWQARLDVPEAALHRFQATLGREGLAKADGFRFERHRNRYIASRGLLRALAGSYLEMDPADLQFSYGPFGKPFVAADSREQLLHFNLSHSDDLALFAFSRDQEIGIDLERVRAGFDLEGTAESWFPPAALEELRSSAAAARVLEFYRIWTWLEACAKASGTGLSALDSEKVQLRERCADLCEWTVRTFDPQPGFVAAIAAKTIATVWHSTYSAC